MLIKRKGLDGEWQVDGRVMFVSLDGKVIKDES